MLPCGHAHASLRPPTSVQSGIETLAQQAHGLRLLPEQCGDVGAAYRLSSGFLSELFADRPRARCITKACRDGTEASQGSQAEAACRILCQQLFIHSARLLPALEPVQALR
jgi:hypothetical protein